MKTLANILIIILFFLYFPFAFIFRICFWTIIALNFLIQPLTRPIFKTLNDKDEWKITTFLGKFIEWMTEVEI